MSLSNSYHIHVSPQRSLVDDVISIRITGAETGQPITLLARTEDDGKRFFSYAHFFTDGQDEIDLQNSASRGGFYKGKINLSSICHIIIGKIKLSITMGPVISLPPGMPFNVTGHVIMVIIN